MRTKQARICNDIYDELVKIFRDVKALKERAEEIRDIVDEIKPLIK
jgi:hypothetical protein